MMQLAGSADARMSGGRLNIIGLTEAIFGFLWGVMICDHGQSQAEFVTRIQFRRRKTSPRKA
jgi:hypothetical protein